MLPKITTRWNISLIGLVVFIGMGSMGFYRSERLPTFSPDQNVWLRKGNRFIARGGRNWSYALLAQPVPENAAIEAMVQILRSSNRKGIGGALNWFPYNLQREDPGYDACLILRHFGSSPTEAWWYRIQVSLAYQEVVLHKGNGGYVKVAPAKIVLGKTFLLRAELRQSRIRVWLDGQLLIDYLDEVSPILGPGGKWGIGNYESHVSFESVKVLPHSEIELLELPRRRYTMSYRTWHEGFWIFSDDEPIAQFILKESQIAEMKLLPGYQPQLHAALSWLEEDQVPPIATELKPIDEDKTTGHLSFLVRGRTRFPKMRTENILRIGYDVELGSYFYEFRGSAHLDHTDVNLTKIRTVKYNVLFPYNSSPNAWKNQFYNPQSPLALGEPLLSKQISRSDDFPFYHWELFHGMDGILYRTPIRNDWDIEVPPSYRTRPYFYRTDFRPDTRANKILARALHPISNPAITFYHDEETGIPSTAICSFSHETHLGWEISNKHDFYAHYRYHGISPHRMSKLFLSAHIHSNPHPPRIRILHKMGVNRFGVEQQNTTSEPLVALSWVGAYDLDSSMGFDDSHSLVLRNGGWTEFRPVSRGKPTHQLVPRYSLKFRLRGENSNGGKLLIDFYRDDHRERNIVSPIPDRQWQYVELFTKLFWNEGKSKVRIQYEGTGNVWVDNVELDPVEASPFLSPFYAAH